MLTVSNLSKRYGNVLALQNVSFHIDGQESAAVFGMAGSGKSTLASLLSGFLECSPGQIRIGGYDMGKAAEKARGLIGYLPEGNPLYGDMSVYEYLEFICSLYKVALKKRRAQISWAMECCEIAEHRHTPIRELSSLNARRAGIAGAIVFSPPFLLFDRPSFALRAEDASKVRALISSLRKAFTLLLLTDSLSDVTDLCSHVIVLNRGQVVSDSTLSMLEAMAGQSNRLKLRVAGAPSELRALFSMLPGVLDVGFERTFEAGTLDVLLEVQRGMDIRRDIWQLALKAHLPILEMRSISVSLEDIFLQLTGSGGGGA